MSAWLFSGEGHSRRWARMSDVMLGSRGGDRWATHGRTGRASIHELMMLRRHRPRAGSNVSPALPRFAQPSVRDKVRNRQRAFYCRKPIHAPILGPMPPSCRCRLVACASLWMAGKGEACALAAPNSDDWVEKEPQRCGVAAPCKHIGGIMAALCVLSGAAMVQPWCWHGAGTVLAWCWHGAGMVQPWCWHGAGMVLAWCSHGAAMVLARCSHGAVMVLARCWYGAAMVLAWLSAFAAACSIGHVRRVCRASLPSL